MKNQQLFYKKSTSTIEKSNANIYPVRNSDNLGVSEQIVPMRASHKLPYSRIPVETSNRTLYRSFDKQFGLSQ